MCQGFRGYCSGDEVYARVIDQIGLDRAHVPPVFLDTPVRKIHIDKTKVVKLNELTHEDFEGAAPDVKDVESLVYHLGLIYNLDIDTLPSDAEVTRVEFHYLD